MDIDSIKKELREMPEQQRREIAIYLTHLELVADANYFETLRSRMNDQLAQSWHDLDDVNDEPLPHA